MRRIVLLLASAALAVGVLFFGTSALVGGGGTQTAAAQTAQPNIVYILTDDMRKDDLRFMPKTRALLKDKGMTFDNAFVSNALCCPSRATIMRGQYSHNTTVFTNGHYSNYINLGGERDNMGTRLLGAGYRTGLFGKYLNGYNGSYVPVGWSDWFSGQLSGDEFFNYDINDNGQQRHYGTSDSDYITDVLKGETQQFIGASVAQGKPFFAYVAPTAPHDPATPAPRHAHAYDGLKAPRPSSFNERDVSDKPPWIRQLPSLSSSDIAQIDKRYEKRAESLQAVDGLVEGVVNKLNSAGVMGNTYVVFTSDHGYHHGEHRIPYAKGRPYEESNRVPLLVRGPGVAAGSTTYKMALNTDHLPTFTSLAGTQTPPYVDGRSLRPVLNQSATTWRDAILLEGPGNGARIASPTYYGIRTVGSSKQKYVEYAGSGAKELYYLGSDPLELTNKYSSGAASGLASRLQALKGCAQDTCRTAENGQ
jgi:arylsulfatase A-like enzyme